ncbi:MAG: NAD(P)-dependent oxidoreductase [Balneolaceae bacterium]|nr:NAD(P)-dependent oxidoreductase [Balneolaceae bacterium]
MENVLVTGASGFIGQSTIPLLIDKGYRVFAVTTRIHTQDLNRSVTWLTGDILNPGNVSEICRKADADLLLHLAWYDDPADRMSSAGNLPWVGATLHLAKEFLEQGGRRIVTAGSCAEYDWQYGYCSEGITPEQPATLYGECKTAVYKLLTKYCNAREVEYGNARIFFVYGPQEPEQRFVPYVINTLLDGRQPAINHGDHLRDYLHVSDVAGALVALLSSDLRGSVNIAGGNPVSLRDIAGMIARTLDREHLVDNTNSGFGNAKDRVVFADTSRLRHELGWKPTFQLEQGITDTINWWKQKHNVTAI